MCGSTRAFSRRASHRIAVPSTAAASPITSAHPNSATVGRSNGGRPGITSDTDPSPTSESSPTKISAPIPAASSPGTSTREPARPAIPDASSSRNAPSRGEPEQRAHRREAAGRAHDGDGLGGGVPLDQLHRPGAERRAHRDQRSLRAEDHAQREGGERGQEDPQQLARGRRIVRVEAVRRRLPAPAGEVADGEAHQQPGQQQREDRPPDGVVQPELLGQVGEDPRLHCGRRAAGRSTPRRRSARRARPRSAGWPRSPSTA